MKKFLLLAMTLLMALSLVAGCGSDSLIKNGDRS